MKPLILFIAFIFLFSSSWGDYTKDEIKKMWANTNHNFKVLFYVLDAENCYRSKKKFSACMMAFNNLLSQIKKDGKDDGCHQLRVSDTNKLEIVPFAKKRSPKIRKGKSGIHEETQRIL